MYRHGNATAGTRNAHCLLQYLGLHNHVAFEVATSRRAARELDHSRTPGEWMASIPRCSVLSTMKYYLASSFEGSVLPRPNNHRRALRSASLTYALCCAPQVPTMWTKDTFIVASRVRILAARYALLSDLRRPGNRSCVMRYHEVYVVVFLPG